MIPTKVILTWPTTWLTRVYLGYNTIWYNYSEWVYKPTCNCIAAEADSSKLFAFPRSWRRHWRERPSDNQQGSFHGYFGVIDFSDLAGDTLAADQKGIPIPYFRSLDPHWDMPPVGTASQRGKYGQNTAWTPAWTSDYLSYMERIYHRIGWWENLQENPIFDGKNHGFL